jgi:hypothetical protein
VGISGKAFGTLPESWQIEIIAPFGLPWDLRVEIETMCRLASACCEKTRD